MATVWLHSVVIFCSNVSVHAKDKLFCNFVHFLYSCLPSDCTILQLADMIA